MTRKALADLVALGEGFTTEFKRAGTSGLGREICAFANATGGTILIGVTNDGDVVGVDDHNDLKSAVQSIARTAEPPIAVEIESAGRVLSVRVPAQHGKPYSFGGRFYLREGASSQQMSREEIRDFFFRGRTHPLRRDALPPLRHRARPDAGGLAPVRPPRAASRRSGADGGAEEPASDHRRRDDPRRGVAAGRRHHPLHAGGGVTCALLQGVTGTHIIDRKDFTGDLYSIFEACIAYLKAKLNTALIPHALGRHERLELPEDALREALVNAIAHRDYRSTANVQVHIFHDRVEMVTPGGLPAGMPEAALGTKSVPRNPLLFGMLYRMRLVEQIGSGIRRIRELCRDHRVAEPVIAVSEDWVTTTFARPAEPAGTRVRQPGPDIPRVLPPKRSPGASQVPPEPAGGSGSGDQVGTKSRDQVEGPSRGTKSGPGFDPPELPGSKHTGRTDARGRQEQPDQVPGPGSRTADGGRVAGDDRPRQAPQQQAEVPADGQGPGVARWPAADSVTRCASAPKTIAGRDW